MGKASRRRAEASTRTGTRPKTTWEILRPIVTMGAVAVGCAGIIAVAAIASATSKPDTDSTPGIDEQAAAPTGTLPAGNATPFAVPYAAAKPASKDARTVEIVSDFQCPACALAETNRVKTMTALADSGDINLVWRPTTVLDALLGNQASAHATAAWGCAIDAGKGEQYRSALYANQPADAKAGWTDQELIDIAAKAQIASPGFADCVTEGRYLDWAANASASLPSADPAALPAVRYNGSDIPLNKQTDATTVLAYLDSADEAAAAAASQAAAASASASASPSASASAAASGSPSTSTSPSPAQVSPSGR